MVKQYVGVILLRTHIHFVVALLPIVCYVEVNYSKTFDFQIARDFGCRGFHPDFMVAFDEEIEDFSLIGLQLE